MRRIQGPRSFRRMPQSPQLKCAVIFLFAACFFTVLASIVLHGYIESSFASTEWIAGESAAMFSPRSLYDSVRGGEIQNQRSKVSFDRRISPQFQTETRRANIPAQVPPNSTRPTIAYVVTIVECGSRRGGKIGWRSNHTFLDAATVLHHSIRRNAYPVNPDSPYGYKMYALLVIDKGKEASCEPTLALLRSAGYEVRAKTHPVHHPLWHVVKNHTNLKHPYMRPMIKDEPCCGPNEFIKLRAYELLEHPVAVLLDMDALLLRPFDLLFDAMLKDEASPGGKRARERLISDGMLAPTRQLQYVDDASGASLLPSQIDGFYTRDWGNSSPETAEWVGLQGGFLILRPSLEAYENLRNILIDGNFIVGRGKGTGWGGTGYGNHIYGGMTFQGLMAYYQEYNATTKGIELHSCRFNMMATNPRLTRGAKFPRPSPLRLESSPHKDGACRDGRKECDDVQCQTQNMDEVFSLHYTHCHKPWTCPEKEQNSLREGTCAAMHREWFLVRRELENELRGKGIVGTNLDVTSGQFDMDSFLGYCNSSGVYNPIEFIQDSVMK